MAKLWFIWVALLAASMATGAEPVPRATVVEYTVTDLGLKLRAVAINARGEIAGTLETGAESSQAMMWTKGTWRRLGAFSGSRSVACGINDAGQVVGFATLSAPDRNRWMEHGFLYANGAMTDLGADGAGLERAVAINATGLVAGESDQKGWCCDGAKRTSLGVMLTSVSERVLPVAINRGGAIVGGATVGGANGSEAAHAFLFSKGALVDLGALGGDYSLAEGISDQGWVVGRSRPRGGGSGFGHAFLYRDGRMRDLGVPDGFESSDAKGINAQGIIVGEASTVTGSGFLRIDVDSRAYRYKDGAWTDLNSVVDLSGTGIGRLTSAVAINDAGQIIGQASGNDGWRGFLLTPVARSPR